MSLQSLYQVVALQQCLGGHGPPAYDESLRIWAARIECSLPGERFLAQGVARALRALETVTEIVATTRTLVWQSISTKTWRSA
jgi:hypothetical protein